MPAAKKLNTQNSAFSPSSKLQTSTLMAGPLAVWSLVIWIFIGALSFEFGTASAVAARPNIVLIFIDDMGYADIGPFCNTKVRTPHLDKMAAEGMKFTSFYATPVCSMSRACLLTGCYNTRVSKLLEQIIADGRSTPGAKQANEVPIQIRKKAGKAIEE